MRPRRGERLTEAKFKLAEQKRTEGMLAKIIDGSPIPTFAINKQYKVTHWNTALESLSGIKRDEIVGTDEQWRAFYLEKRPVMADLIVDGASAGEIELYYRGKSRKSGLIDGAYEAEDFFPELGEDGKWLHFTASPIRDNKGEIMGAVETLQDITKRKRAEHALNERVKELQCLYSIANIAQRPGITLDELYQEVANLLPEGWQYPEIACARITINNKRFETENCRESEWKLSSDIKVHGERIGVVEINYLEERPDADEGPFLREERLLINAVVERLGRITEEKRLQDNARFYVQQITRVQEEERKRIARELHDDLAQSLLLLTQGLDFLSSTARKKLSDAKLKQSLEKLRSQAIDTLEGLRRYAQDLRPPILDHQGTGSCCG